MVDITPLFKASVKTVRTRNKALGLTKNLAEDPNRILIRPPRESKFQLRAKDTFLTLMKLKEFLNENRNAYLEVQVILNQSRKLSLHDRIEIDSQTEAVIKNCRQNLQELRLEINNTAANSQTVEHQHTVLSIIENYFKTICKIYDEMKESQKKRQQDLLKITKIEGDGHHLRKSSFGLSSLPENLVETSRTYSPYQDEVEKFEETDQLTLAEKQLFEKENSLLYNELNSVDEEVDAVQSRVTKIAGLQQTLSENILEQGIDAERILMTTVSSTETIRDGNEQLRQAMQGNGGLRIGILFVILVLTFTVLFLDWYND